MQPQNLFFNPGTQSLLSVDALSGRPKLNKYRKGCWRSSGCFLHARKDCVDGGSPLLGGIIVFQPIHLMFLGGFFGVPF